MDKWNRVQTLVVAMLGLAVFACPRPALALSLDDLIFTSDDDVTRAPGCDAHSVIDASSGEVVARGDQIVSTGRLASDVDGSLVVSISNHGGHIYIHRREGESLRHWRTDSIRSPLPKSGGAIAIAPSGAYFVFATSRGISKYPVESLRRGRLGPSEGAYSGVDAVELVISADGTVQKRDGPG